MTGAEQFPGLTLAELEQQLADPRLPAPRRSALEAEYERRLTLELLGADPGAPGAPVGPWVEVPRPRAQPFSPAPPRTRQIIRQPPPGPYGPAYGPPPAAVPPASPAGRGAGTGRGSGWVLAVLLLVGLVGAGAWLFSRPTENTDDPGSGSYAGVTGTVQVDWTEGRFSYTAIVTTANATGHADVRILDPSTGRTTAVRESLTLDGGAGAWRYAGSDAREVDSGVPATGYTPDTFTLASSGAGRVQIDRVCDPQGVTCVPARMTLR